MIYLKVYLMANNLHFINEDAKLKAMMTPEQITNNCVFDYIAVWSSSIEL